MAAETITAEDLHARYDAAFATMTADQMWAVDQLVGARCMASFTETTVQRRLLEGFERQASCGAAAG